MVVHIENVIYIKLIEFLSINVLSSCIYMHIYDVLDLVNQILAFVKSSFT